MFKKILINTISLGLGMLLAVSIYKLCGYVYNNAVGTGIKYINEDEGHIRIYVETAVGAILMFATLSIAQSFFIARYIKK